MTEALLKAKKEKEDARKKKYNEAPATDLWKIIKEIPENAELYQKRWFWELLQNAADYNENVSIRVKVSDASLTFEHNGAPFKLGDIENLIIPFSGKPGNEGEINTIGKYGTGFVSTHVVSSRISIACKAKDSEGRFVSSSFKLDRSCFLTKDRIEEQVKSILKSLGESDELKECDYKNGEYHTSFSYDLQSPLLEGLSCRDAVTKGLLFVKEILPYTLCFLEGVNKIEIRNDSSFLPELGTNWVISDDGENGNVKFFKDSIEGRISMYTSNVDNELFTAVKIRDGEICPYPIDIPKVFLALPMVGTENFNLPIIIHSRKFEPSGTERKGLKLTEKATNNRSVFSKVYSLYANLIEQLKSEYTARNFFHLGFIRAPEGLDNSELNWFKNNVLDKIHTTIRTSLPVRVMGPGGEKTVVLNDARFVEFKLELDKTEELHRLVQGRNLALTPEWEDNITWCRTIDFNVFKSNLFTEHDVLKQIESKADSYEEENAEATAEFCNWLHDFLKLVIENDKDKNLLLGKRVFPNRDFEVETAKGKLLKSSGEVYVDLVTKRELISVYDSASKESYRSRLLHPQFKEIFLTIAADKAKDDSQLGKAIDECLKSKYQATNEVNTIADAVEKLFKWLASTEGMKSEESNWVKENLEWFHLKKATLLLELMPPKDRDKHIRISQSGKLDALTRFAEDGSVTNSQLNEIADNISRVNAYLNWLKSKVDDETYANPSTGKEGEEIVYADLKHHFSSPDYEVIWESQDNNEARFDFRILRNGQTVFFVDAKSTSQGMGNSDTIPLFVRMSQWDFLAKSESKVGYYLARVFLDSHNPIVAPQVKYLATELLQKPESRH